MNLSPARYQSDTASGPWTTGADCATALMAPSDDIATAIALAKRNFDTPNSCDDGSKEVPERLPRSRDSFPVGVSAR